MPNRAAARPTRDRPRRAVTLAALARLIAYSVSTKQRAYTPEPRRSAGVKAPSFWVR